MREPSPGAAQSARGQRALVVAVVAALLAAAASLALRRSTAVEGSVYDQAYIKHPAYDQARDAYAYTSEWVRGATCAATAGAPDPASLDRLLDDAWRQANDSEFESGDAAYRLLARRLVHADAVVAGKALVAAHRLVRFGPPQSLRAARARLTWALEAVRAHWSARSDVNVDREAARGRVLAAHAAYLAERLRLHAILPQLGPAFDVESEGAPSPGPFSMEGVAHLCRLLQTLLAALRTFLRGPEAPSTDASGAPVAAASLSATAAASRQRAAVLPTLLLDLRDLLAACYFAQERLADRLAGAGLAGAAVLAGPGGYSATLASAHRSARALLAEAGEVPELERALGGAASLIPSDPLQLGRPQRVQRPAAPAASDGTGEARCREEAAESRGEQLLESLVGAGGAPLELEDGAGPEAEMAMEAGVGEAWGFDMAEVEVDYRAPIGDGVYRGRWRGTEVAVKAWWLREDVPPDQRAQALDDLRAELSIHRAVRHPNILLLLGDSIRPPNFTIVTEFCAHGTLESLLRNGSAAFGWPIVRRWALQIARALNYLHLSKPPIVHCDVFPRNVFVDEALSAKLADFGISAVMNKASAGERLIQFGIKCAEDEDVRAFGRLLWWMLTRGETLEGLQPDAPAAAADLVRRCLDASPEARPSVSAVIAALESLG